MYVSKMDGDNVTIGGSSSNDSYSPREIDNDYYSDVIRYDYDYEHFAFVLVALLFGVVTVLGSLGNLLVIVVVAVNRQMRNTTNLLIIR